MDIYILKVFKRLRKEAPRRIRDFRISADSLILRIEEKSERGIVTDDVEQYIELLKAGCLTRIPKMMEISLDAIHYLIEHGYLRGEKDSLTTCSMMLNVIETVSRCSDEFDDSVQLQVIKALLVAVTSEYCHVHEGSLLLAIRACFHVNLITKNQTNKTTAKAALTQMLSVVNQRMEVHDLRLKDLVDSQQINRNLISNGSESEDRNLPAAEAVVDPIPETIGESNTPSASESQYDMEIKSNGADGFDLTTNGEDVFSSVYHKDSFLLYRALCKLSMKSAPEDHASLSDPIVLQNKILSLELLLHILQTCGPAFRTGEKFIHVSKSYLCVSILGNCTSQVPLVTSLSLQVFVAVMDNFKDHLKSELEVFVTNIFLRILESENSPYDHKLRVLQVFYNIIDDPIGLVEIFINFDCDFEAIDLFRRIVDAFSKTAKNTNIIPKIGDFLSSAKRAVSEEFNIKAKCCEGLVVILQSLIKSAGYTASVDTDPKASSRKVLGLSDRSVVSGESDTLDAVVEDELVSSVTDSGVDAVEVYDRKQKIQEEIETGILKFNQSAKKGIGYLVNLGHFELTPKGVASFFNQYQDRLDKTVIGEYLGREKEYDNGFCLKVLHEYVDAMDFRDMKFDIAIRYYLSGFRLPGEAQKIDRIMEKFAERYYLQNRNTFPSADTAFILAFSTIMLQTNLHNPAIRDDKRMTKEQFIQQNKRISADLSDEMLKEIYDRILAEPISLTQDEKLLKKAKKDEQSFLVFPTSYDKKRKDAYADERKEMIRLSEAIFKQKLKSRRPSTFIRSAQTLEAYARPMFEIAWPPMLSVFSQMLETMDDPVVIDFCLRGFQLAIQLASRMDLAVARNTFVNSLTKFTTLDSVRSMQPKNIEAIKILLYIAQTEGEYLNDSWHQMLQFVSQLSRLQLFAERVHTDEMFFGSQSNDSTDVSKSKRSISADPFKYFMAPTKAETVRQVEETNAEMIMLEINSIQIDKIFVNSQNLTSDSMHFFIKALCSVSLLEINSSSSMGVLRGRDVSSEMSTPRVFSMQKIVEVADYNMHIRSRISWSNIWSDLATHFTKVGSHENFALAMYAVDSLKQLSIKFLQKDELSNFNFQRLFLKPFEVIMSKSKSTEIKELVLRCLDIMIRACAPNIRSGWRSIFFVFEIAAGNEHYEIASIAFDITERLMNEQFKLLIFDFVELMNCLVAFVAGTHTYLSLSALEHLSKCADMLALGVVEPALESQNGSSDPLVIPWEQSNRNADQIGEDASVFRLWWPLLLGLSTRVADARLQVRNKALEVLVHILKSYGNKFSKQTWAVIFKGVLLPMLDSAKTDFTKQPESSWPTENPNPSIDPFSWIATSSGRVLKACSELYLQFRATGLTSSLLSDLLNAIDSCICQDIESLARIGLHSLYDLLVSFKSIGSSDLDAKEGELICVALCSLISKNLCKEFAENGTLALNSIDRMKSGIDTSECPLALRRRSKDNSDIGSTVKTPFGLGRLMQDVSTDDVLGIPSRKKISLSWGGFLFSIENFKSQRNNENPRDSRSVDGNLLWDDISKSVLTSMVVSLELIRITEETICLFFQCWGTSHFMKFSETVAESYAHAKSFNENMALRENLRGKEFMKFPNKINNLPNILEQELKAGTLLVTLLLRLGGESCSIPAKVNLIFTRNWIEWSMTSILKRYVNLDEGLDSPNLHSKASEQIMALNSLTAVVLNGILKFSSIEFEENKVWIIPSISPLFVCDNKMIRIILRDIYVKHVHSLILS